MSHPLEILTQYWGYDSFRPMQEEIIRSAATYRDTVALLPTGGGKSLCFQIPALMKPGMALVISPLIALMQDQVDRLNDLGIPATFINNSIPFRSVDYRLDMAMKGKYKFLYLAPERIRSGMFMKRLERMEVNLLAIDEAHCISQWGHDFRPAFLEIHKIREVKRGIHTIALTASATPKVRKDIVEKLRMQKPAVFVKSFQRENLRYFVLENENPTNKILEVIQRVKGSGIVYVRTRRGTQAIASNLGQAGISAEAYHGGMTASARNKVQQAWINNSVRVVVATNAFGMGIDKPDVRFVIHYHLPADLESYYQEAGRAGRDGERALAISFRNPSDIAELRNWVAGKYPETSVIQQTLVNLYKHYHIPEYGAVDELRELDMEEVGKKIKLPVRILSNILRLLHTQGVIVLNDKKDDYAYLEMLATPESLLNYKENHPKYATLIDALLRRMGGELFSHEKRFIPKFMARAMGLKETELLTGLERLSAHKVISFRPPSDIPSIRFVHPLKAVHPGRIDYQLIDKLRQESNFRFRSVLRYVNDNQVCRSRIILEYFGEDKVEACGKCDICVGRTKASMGDKGFQAIRREILEILSVESHTYGALLNRLTLGTYAQREQTLRQLLDAREIRSDEHGLLSLL